MILPITWEGGTCIPGLHWKLPPRLWPMSCAGQPAKFSVGNKTSEYLAFCSLECHESVFETAVCDFIMKITSSASASITDKAGQQRSKVFSRQNMNIEEIFQSMLGVSKLVKN